MDQNHYKILSKNLLYKLRNKFPYEVITCICNFLNEPFLIYGKYYYDIILKELRTDFMVPIPVYLCFNCSYNSENCLCPNGIQIVEPDFNFDSESVFFFSDISMIDSNYNPEQITELIQKWKNKPKYKLSCANIFSSLLNKLSCK